MPVCVSLDSVVRSSVAALIPRASYLTSSGHDRGLEIGIEGEIDDSTHCPHLKLSRCATIRGLEGCQLMGFSDRLVSPSAYEEADDMEKKTKRESPPPPASASPCLENSAGMVYFVQMRTGEEPARGRSTEPGLLPPKGSDSRSCPYRERQRISPSDYEGKAHVQTGLAATTTAVHGTEVTRVRQWSTAEEPKPIPGQQAERARGAVGRALDFCPTTHEFEPRVPQRLWLGIAG
ncbi:unnamed protein product [Schistocephalus solidus]|uniref:Uncharacterized protein n=1 Tax=Schistocephalus solidus TaxID=70667 RepID=A0A183TPV0_SCHSO|nr:unnamed protein product [Schistocephalus solidus]